MGCRVFLLLLGIHICRAAAPSTNQPSFKTSFEPEATLTQSEIKSVIALAHKCGIAQVGEIYTYHIPPSSAYGVGVNGMGTTNGRKVTIVNVHIESERLLRSSERRNVVKAEGNFWVARGGGPHTNVYTTFTVQGQSILVTLEKMDLIAADKIIGMLAAGKVRYANESLKLRSRDIKLAEPITISRAEGKKAISICYSTAPCCLYWLDCTVEGDGIVVRDVSEIVS